MDINYHIHTPLCNHASGSMDDFVKAAIASGLKEICFLDHLTLNPADNGNSMTPGEIPHYLLDAWELRDRYRNDIAIKVGLEVDYTPSAIRVINAVISQYPFDVIGGAVHFLGDQNIVSHKSDWGHGIGDPDEIYSDYYATILEMLDEDYLDVVCHLDLIKKFKRKPDGAFADKINEVLRKIRDTQRVVEVNTSGFDHPVAEPYPSVSILKQCRKYDIPITLGSDAHQPDQLTRCYEKAKAAIKAAGYDQLTVFTERTQEKRPL